MIVVIGTRIERIERIFTGLRSDLRNLKDFVNLIPLSIPTKKFNGIILIKSVGLTQFVEK